MYLLVPTLVRDTVSGYSERRLRGTPVARINIGTGTCTFVGDTHGALDVSSYILSKKLSSDAICFLGDTVDRGENQLLNLLNILEASLLDERIILVRGNHESPDMNTRYGFADEMRAWGYFDELYPEFVSLFGKLPYACVVNGRILGVHGGIPRGCQDMNSWESIPMNETKPFDECAFQILWNDPHSGNGFETGNRGEGTYLYGRDVLSDFLNRNHLYHLIRGHQVKMDGCEIEFDGKLITVFSSRYHGGKACAVDVIFNGIVETKVDTLPDQETIEGDWE